MRTFADLGIHLRAGATGETKTTCPWCSNTRKKKGYPCLNVNVEKGLYNCWHCGASGSLKDGQYSAPQIKKSYIKPDYVAQTKSPATIESWFSERGITPDVLRRNQVGAGTIYFPQVEEERGCVMFPYMRGGEVINIKYRTRDKLFRMAAGAERVLYGLNDIGETLVWVEGEIDKLSLEVAGVVSCVSVPDGAPAADAKNYSNKFDFMDAPEITAVQVHIIAVDNDAPGKALERELIRRLGPEKCKRVAWPEGCKDANDVLVKHGSETLAQCIASAEPMPIAGSCTISDYHDSFVTLYEKGQDRGYTTGWMDVDQYYTVKVGDLTVVTGIPNSGKSEWLDALMVNLAHQQGWAFGVFSAENWPVTEHAKKLAEKYVGKPFETGRSERMSVSERDMAESWLSQHFFFVQPESPTIESILSIMRQLVLRNGIRGLIIDPWNEIEHSRPEKMTETEYIGGVLSEIRRFCRTHLLTAWVVAHPTKLSKGPDGNYPVPTPYDISGSANWRNKADNCVTIWRDLSPDNGNVVEIHIQKIRHKSVGQIGMAKLTYNRVTGIYSGTMKSTPPIMDKKRLAAGEMEVSL